MTIAILFLSGMSFGQITFGDVTGKVLQYKTNEIIYGARVFIIDQDKIYNTSTNYDGEFKISAVPAGIYTVNICKNGDTLPVHNVKVLAEAVQDMGTIFYTNNILELPQAIVSAKGDGGIKLIKGFLPLPRLDATEIEKSPVKFDINSLVSSMTTDVQMADDGSLVFRGARKGDMIYYVDGMKVVGELRLPSTAISNMMVYSGGLPAQFGDTMGGVVSIETKGYFELLRNYESAQLRMGN